MPLPNAPKPKSPGPPRPQGGLPGMDPLSQGGPPGMPPGMPPGLDPMAMGAGGLPPGMPPGPAMMPPGAPKPGQAMDPMMAMLNGMPPMPGGMGMPPPPPPPGPPMGPNGMPIGGTEPSADPYFQPDMGGSSLLQGLGQAIGDPYAAGPEGHAELEGMGPQDPQMGLEQLIQLIAMAQSGAGPDTGMGGQMPPEFGPPGMPMPMGVRPGGSGVNFDRGRPGMMI